jgi:hypothetical protein
VHIAARLLRNGAPDMNGERNRFDVTVRYVHSPDFAALRNYD